MIQTLGAPQIKTLPTISGSLRPIQPKGKREVPTVKLYPPSYQRPSSPAEKMARIRWKSPIIIAPVGFVCLAGLLYVYSTVAVASAKSNARRLREQDGGLLDLRRQSRRQHGLLHDEDSVGPRTPPVEASQVPTGPNSNTTNTREEAVRAEKQRRKEEARERELEEIRRLQKDRNSLWNWVRGK